MQNISAVIMHDVFASPVSSRIYAYSSIAAYEAAHAGNDQYPSMAGKLNEFPAIVPPENKNEIDFPLAGIYALLFTAKYFIYSEQSVADAADSVTEKYNYFLSPEMMSATQSYAKEIALTVFNWSKGDHYAATRNMPRYVLLNSPSSWQPTSPDYADALEPYWGTLRTFALDSATQFSAITPTFFSSDTASEFYRDAMEVYTKCASISSEEKMIVSFWDDNPFTTVYGGHFQYAVKKLSPAGHWMNITSEAIVASQGDIYKAFLSYAAVSMTIADAFISCWREKYKYSTIRPESYINQFIDEQWKPFIQTPPFPEYTSGHSTVSAAAAEMLTFLFGPDFSFSDKSETDFDLPERKFSSFYEAAEEAGISRLYGGIHFMPAIVNGAKSGKAIGNYIARKLFTT